jgi:hypothetical protein
MSNGKLKIVFVDTNVIIEAHRTGCWKALAASYDIHTVEAVREESLRRPKGDIDYIPIDAAVFDFSRSYLCLYGKALMTILYAIRTSKGY